MCRPQLPVIITVHWHNLNVCVFWLSVQSDLRQGPSGIGLKLGPAKKLLNAIQELRVRSHTHSESEVPVVVSTAAASVSAPLAVPSASPLAQLSASLPSLTHSDSDYASSAGGVDSEEVADQH
jgi:hypothetical protein